MERSLFIGDAGRGRDHCPKSLSNQKGELPYPMSSKVIFTKGHFKGTEGRAPRPSYLTRSMTLLDIPIILANCRIDTPSNSFNSKIIAFLISLSICCKELLVGKPNLFR